jgi:polyisoprenoid-binding protein YceI
MISLKKRSKTLLCLFGFALLFNVQLRAQTSFTSKEIKINLFSSTPLEDIKAQALNGVSVIIPKTKQVVFQLPIKNFVFSRSLMQEHFNESYMESDKYPTASFKGNLIENIDFKQDGSYNVNVKGVLNMHGVAKDRTIRGVITVKDGKPSISSSFDVACADHKIKIPSVVFKKIAEVITVTISGNYQ